jgi:uncharacterized protein (TIRG00374 family)
MQDNHDSQMKSGARPRLARTRFVGLDPTQQRITGVLPATGDLGADQPTSTTGSVEATSTRSAIKKAARPIELSGERSVAAQSIAHLLQLSGMMRPLRKSGNTPLPGQLETEEDCYWPLGIQQVGPLPILNLYGHEAYGRALPTSVPLVLSGNLPQDAAQKPALWRRVISSSIFRITLGLLIGLGLLALAAFFVDLPSMLNILGTHLTTPQDIGLGLLAGLVYVVGRVLRGLRWQCFLNSVGKIRTDTVLQISLVAAFLNFLLPIRAGEAAKSLALKRLANIPLSKSLPTVAMDRTLDLVPALLIVTLLPVLGIHLNLQLWIVFGLGATLLFCTLVLLVLTAWRRPLAFSILRTVCAFLPRAAANRVEGFITGFLDGLLAGISRPLMFLPALLLTCLALGCDGLFVMLVFKTIGFQITFSTALLGYALLGLFALLPALPGRLGSAEIVGLLIFAGLLGLPVATVAATYVFAHLWAALLITGAGLIGLTALGLTVPKIMRVQDETIVGERELNS